MLMHSKIMFDPYYCINSMIQYIHLNLRKKWLFTMPLFHSQKVVKRFHQYSCSEAKPLIRVINRSAVVKCSVAE